MHASGLKEVGKTQMLAGSAGYSEFFLETCSVWTPIGGAALGWEATEQREGKHTFLATSVL